jgi:hypothetical protein
VRELAAIKRVVDIDPFVKGSELMMGTSDICCKEIKGSLIDQTMVASPVSAMLPINLKSEFVLMILDLLSTDR